MHRNWFKQDLPSVNFYLNNRGVAIRKRRVEPLPNKVNKSLGASYIPVFHQRNSKWWEWFSHKQPVLCPFLWPSQILWLVIDKDTSLFTHKMKQSTLDLMLWMLSFTRCCMVDQDSIHYIGLHPTTNYQHFEWGNLNSTVIFDWAVNRHTDTPGLLRIKITDRVGIYSFRCIRYVAANLFSMDTIWCPRRREDHSVKLISTHKANFEPGSFKKP